MSFWNFLGEFAIINMFYNWLSGKPNHKSQPVQQSHDRYLDAEYYNNIDELRDSEISDIDELQDRIDELESQLDDCDMMSDRYDRIQDRIDTLQERIDDIEYNNDICDDLDDLELDDDIQDEMDDLYDNLDDFGSDDDW